jgi:hypothetical protein
MSLRKSILIILKNNAVYYKLTKKIKNNEEIIRLSNIISLNDIIAS